MAESLEIASDNTDLWGRDLNATFMVQDLKRSGLRATDFPHGCEMLPPNDEGQERYRFGVTADYAKTRVDRKENKYYGPKGVPPPIAVLGNPDNAKIIATVEGYKKALLFHITTGIPTIALDGCWMFGELVEVDQEACVKNLANTVLMCLAPGQDHFVLFDGDIATNENVRKAASTYRVLLEEQGAKTRFKDLGHGPDESRYGYDDWFVAQYGVDRERWPDKHNLLMTLVREVKDVAGNHLLGGALSFMLGNMDRFSNEFLDLNDRGAGSLLVKLIGKQNIKYLRDTGEWVRWEKLDGKWQWVNLGSTPLGMVNVVSKYYYERATVLEHLARKNEQDPDKAKQLLDQAKSYRNYASTACSNTTSRGNILKDLTNGGRREIYLKSSDFDAQSHLLGVQNGVVDLRTGELREETQEDYITRHCTVDYVPSPSPEVGGGRNIENFLQVTCGLDHGVYDLTFYNYLQRRVGIALWGGNKLQSFEIWQGAGSDGKSALALMLQGMLGDSGNGGYAASTKPEVIMSSYRGQNPEGASPFLVLLRGARMVFASETKDNAQLNEALIKQLSGGEKLLARANYQAGGSFKVDFTFFLMTNPMPNCSALDNALLTRLSIAPFKVRWQRPGEQLEDNRHLPIGDAWWVEDAAADRGVREYLLWWAVQGCVAYLREGTLGEIPDRCKAAMLTYKEDADVLAAWMGEYNLVLDPTGVTLIGDLYRSYKDYASGAGHNVLSTVSFVKRLVTKYPNQLTKVVLAGNKRGIKGLLFSS
jgi:P4 family phage/plasmid primase-like protien